MNTNNSKPYEIQPPPLFNGYLTENYSFVYSTGRSKYGVCVRAAPRCHQGFLNLDDTLAKVCLRVLKVKSDIFSQMSVFPLTTYAILLSKQLVDKIDKMINYRGNSPAFVCCYCDASLNENFTGGETRQFEQCCKTRKQTRNENNQT